MLLPHQFNANGTLYLSNQIQDEIDVTILNARKQLHIICVYVYTSAYVSYTTIVMPGHWASHRPQATLGVAFCVGFFFFFLECGCVGFKYKSKFYLRIATKVAN